MKKLFFVLLISLLLSACGTSTDSSSDKSNANGDTIQPIKANLEVPEKAAVNEAVTLSVTITQGENPVDDASEIEFEVWKDGAKSKSKMIKAQHQKEGTYTAENTFDQNGVYFVQSHVTARDMHTMPKTKIVVGGVDKDTSESADEKKATDEHHHHGQTKMDLQFPETITAGKPAPYTVTVTHKSKPLENALVRLEVWEDGSNKHQYINLNETETGTYKTDMTLENQALYHITVHVEKEDIHTHKELKVEVK